MVISRKFIFNGIPSEEYNIIAVTFDEDILFDIGIPFSKTISTDKYSSIYTSFKSEDDMPEEVTLNLMYVDEFNKPQKWTEEKIIEVKKWIVTDDFVRFVSEDNPEYIDYLICTKIQNRMTADMLGVLECTFQPMSHFKYREVKFSKEFTDGNVVIYNPSIIPYKPIVKITNLGDATTVNTVGNFEISGLDKYEIVTIDSLMCTVINEHNENKLSSCNRGWIEFQPGKNTLKIIGNLKLEIICEFPILL